MRPFAACLLLALAQGAGAVEPQIASSGGAVLALRADGTVWKWGGAPGLPTQFAGLADVVSIATAQETGLVTKADGTVWQWGTFSGLLTFYPDPDQITPLDGVRAVATAGDFSYALRHDGTVWAWGINTGGQLGDGTTVTTDATVNKRRTPVQVTGLSNVTAVAASGSFGVALRAEGTVWQWGALVVGPSDPTAVRLTAQTTPVQLATLSGIVQIAAAGAEYGHALALRADGTVWAWGANGAGQLGDFTTEDRPEPVQVAGLANVTSIAAGTTSSYAVTADGKLWLWGAGGLGFVGDGTFTSSAGAVPTPVAGISHPRAVAGSNGLTSSGDIVVVMLRDGTILTWGPNGYQLGNGVGSLTFEGSAPATGLSGVTAVALGEHHTLARRSDGSVWAWGFNDSGQLGDGTHIQRSIPHQLGLSGIASVAAGSVHSLALGADGTVWTWGWNSRGQLGSGNNAARATPDVVPLLSGAVAIAAGYQHSLALGADGTVWAWGRNDDGQLGDGSFVERNQPVRVSGLADVVAIAAGGFHSFARKRDGSIWAWGYNGYGQLGDGTQQSRNVPVQIAGLAGATILAPGLYHTLAIQLETELYGQLYGWGYNGDGQLGGGITNPKLVPTPIAGMNDVVSASGGYVHSVVNRSDGSVWGWGRSPYGQAGYVEGLVTTEHVMSSTLAAFSVTAGGYHTIARTGQGTLHSWGHNHYGQIGNGTRASNWLPYPVSAQGGGVFSAGARAARRADFGGDGYADILWRNYSTGENYLYPMYGREIMGGEGYLRTVPDVSWRIAGTGDFDGDGSADILWRNSSTGENYVYLMSGRLIAGEGYLRTVADAAWEIKGIGDFDGDGKDDLLWRNASTGENYLYPMDGLFIKPGEGYLRTVADTAWQIEGVGDFDGDGRADILWRNATSGENYLYLMQGTTVAGEGYLRTVADTAWQIKGVGDFDGDGRADILWRNGTTGENYLYLMNGVSIASEGYLRTVADLSWQIAAVGDYDGDGRADILWRNGSSGENYLYPMEGTTIKPTEGYVRTVAPGGWTVQGP